MYKIIGKEETFKVLTLSEAMNVAKSMNEFVSIVGKKRVVLVELKRKDYELSGIG
jgi:hypothetical protein